MATTSNDIAIRGDIAIAVAFMHAQRLSSVQKRRANRAVRASVLKRRAIRAGMQKRCANRAGVQKRCANRAVHLGKSQTRQPQLTFSQF